MTSSKRLFDIEDQEEAERLRLLPKEQQRQIIALHLSVANDNEVSKTNREAARRRAKALSRLLKLSRPKGRRS